MEEGNKGQIIRDNVISHNTAEQCAKYRTTTLLDPCFLPLLSSIPVCHELSRRECFYYLFHASFFFMR